MSDIHVFDFDGVLAASLDDDIYKLDTFFGEDELLYQASDEFKIKCDDRSINYRRHMIYQAAASLLSIPMKPGLYFNKCLEIQKTDSKVFILTARASWHATKRARTFLDASDIHPVEMYTVGVATKNPQLIMLTEEYPLDQIYYYEDSDKHVAAARSLNHPRINIIHVPKESGRMADEQLRPFYLRKVQTALARVRKNG